VGPAVLSPSGPWSLAPPPAGRLSKDVPDGRLLFDADSGTTRLLSPLGVFIVELLERQRGACSTAEIVRAVHLEEPESSNHECLSAVETALAELVDARLIAARRPS